MEAQQLDRLRIELEANIRLIDDFGSIERVVGAGVRVIDQIDEAQSRGEQEITLAGFTLAQLGRAQTIELDTAVFDGLVRSGRLELIRDQQTVSALASWERSIRDYIDLATAARTTAEMLLVPALHKRADTAYALLIDRPEGPEVSADFTLSIDDEIQGLIAQKTIILRAAGDALGDAREAAQATIQVIDVAQQN